MRREKVYYVAFVFIITNKCIINIIKLVIKRRTVHVLK